MFCGGKQGIQNVTGPRKEVKERLYFEEQNVQLIYIITMIQFS